MKPIVKWAGGKRRLVDELRARIPAKIGTYAEPFAGGAALFFALAADVMAGKRTWKRAILNDQNEELIATYRAVRDDVGGLIKALKGYRYDRDLFYKERDRETRGLSDVARGARLLFLNRTCFNGLWRVNAAGKFNVPFGRYVNPDIVQEERLREAAEALRGVELCVGDFTKVTKPLGKNDFVYFDPPYVPLSKTAAFTAYDKSGFAEKDQKRLAKEMTRLAKKKAMVMLSNADTPETRALYKEHVTAIVQVSRPINSDPRKRGATAELVVTTFAHDAAATRADDKKRTA